MKFYDQETKDVLKFFKTTEEGLSDKEAKQRLEKYGVNIIQEEKRKSKLRIFLGQFNNFMIILLLVVGFLSLLYAMFSTHDYLDAIVILGTTIVNIIMGYLQENKAEDAIEKLKQYNVTKVMVKRDGKFKEIPSSNLVMGDIIELDAGDTIPADARIIESFFAKTDESLLTGESNSVTKHANVIASNSDLHERSNMIYAGTSIASGKITAVVVNTGMQTEMGKIAKTINTDKEPLTSLQIKVKKISSFISMVAIFLIIFVLGYSLIKDYDLLTVIMLCISMIVASVPECLPVAITATLSIGVSQMAKKKTIVRNLAAIETLGATEIICTDKTGTLTENKMEILSIYKDHQEFLAKDYKAITSDYLLSVMALCNTIHKDIANHLYGDSVDIALAEYAEEKNYKKEKLEKKYKIVVEIPFDSDRKMMSNIYKENDEVKMFSKGSLDNILKNCSKILINGKERKITKEDKETIENQEKIYSENALKVLAIAIKSDIKEHEKTEDYIKEEQKGLCFVGLVAMKDPARANVAASIKTCKEAHIRPIMITGDSLETALAIAKEVGIIDENEEGVLGSDLENLSPKEFKKCVNKYNVFARVNPEHKHMIVEALQKQGKVVAMTGDGVNDAPALKLANVGIGMGESGTDVTKSVSDIILLNDSFSTIVTAVDEGRRIYDNVIINVLYNLSSNFTEIVIILIGMFLSFNIILPLHVLYIDLVADTIPSIMLAFEKASKNNMKKKPNGLNKPIFSPHFIAFLILSVIVEAGVSLAIFFAFKNTLGLALAQTLALLSVVLNEFVFAYNCRSLNEQIYERKIFSNKYLNYGIIGLILVQLLVFLTPIGHIFSLEQVSLTQFAIVFIVNILSFFVIETLKPVLNKIFKDN